MKKIACLLITCVPFFSISSFAWKSQNIPTKEYTLKYHLSGENLEITNSAMSYEDAFENAAKQCFRHFKGKGAISESKGLDIIDVCANPRS